MVGLAARRDPGGTQLAAGTGLTHARTDHKP